MPASSLGAKATRSTGKRSEPGLDLGQVARVRLLPRVEPGIGDLVGQHPVRDHGVDLVAEQRQIGVGATRFGDHHALGVHDEPHRGLRRVVQHLPHGVDAVVEALQRVEDGDVGDGQRRGA